MICQFLIHAKVCSDWREIALTLRDKVFGDDEEPLIDIHDVQVRRCAICVVDMAEKC